MADLIAKQSSISDVIKKIKSAEDITSKKTAVVDTESAKTLISKHESALTESEFKLANQFNRVIGRRLKDDYKRHRLSLAEQTIIDNFNNLVNDLQVIVGVICTKSDIEKYVIDTLESYLSERRVSRE